MGGGCVCLRFAAGSAAWTSRLRIECSHCIQKRLPKNRNELLLDFAMKDFRYLPGVSSLTLEAQACVGCGMCAVVCPHGVLAVAKHEVEIVDPDGCMECGACARNCPVDAVRVTPGVGCATAIIKSWFRKDRMVCCG